VNSSQIVTRHCSGPTLITEQGREFVIFQRMCKILGVRRLHTSSYHACSNGMVKGSTISSIVASHYVNANNKNWDEFVSFYLMSYRATLHTTTGYSPFCLLHGREMLPSTDNLKARLPKDHRRRSTLGIPEIQSEISLQASSESQKEVTSEQ
jgi:hypothetical protein